MSYHALGWIGHDVLDETPDTPNRKVIIEATRIMGIMVKELEVSVLTEAIWLSILGLHGSSCPLLDAPLNNCIAGRIGRRSFLIKTSCRVF